MTRRGEYTEVKTAPTTATPKVPPSSRATSLIADPTPALDGGSIARMASVQGEVTRPSPIAIKIIEATTGPKKAVVLPSVEAR
jgi:hypothetical protein